MTWGEEVMLVVVMVVLAIAVAVAGNDPVADLSIGKEMTGLE